jgi:cobyrinic acid a,c-diamide synthase
MSVPRVLLAPTHRTGLANALAAAAAEIFTAQGLRVRFHHLGPLSPGLSWDRWEGAAFLDPSLYTEETLLGLYDVATRGANLSLISSSVGLLDHREGAEWLPADVARLLDCPVVLVMDCRGWGSGIRALIGGFKMQLPALNLAGAILAGISDREHCEHVRRVLAEDEIPVVGCLFEGDGPGWDAAPPGAWGLPLDTTLLEAVSRQVDLAGLETLAGQRGFLSSQSWMTDRGADGPLILVAGGRGFTPWSRDSIEVLRSAGAQVRRLDLVEDTSLPPETAGLVLAGSPWPAGLSEIALNQQLLREVRQRVSDGLPTVALGGGSLILLSRVQDSLGRTVDLADALAGEAEILWDLDDPAYLEVTAERDGLLFAKGETIVGWLVTDVDLVQPNADWHPPLSIRSPGSGTSQAEGAGTDSLLCSRLMVHFGSKPDMGARFVRSCAVYLDDQSAKRS